MQAVTSTSRKSQTNKILEADIQSALERELGVPVGVVMQVPFTNGPSFTFYPSFDDKIVTALESLEKKYQSSGPTTILRRSGETVPESKAAIAEKWAKEYKAAVRDYIDRGGVSPQTVGFEPRRPDLAEFIMHALTEAESAH